MKITTLPNGNLKMRVTTQKEKQIFRRLHNPQTSNAEQRFVKHFLHTHGYRAIKPEDCDALTSATLITDGKDVWGDLNYQVQSFIQELSKGNEVIWQKG